MNKSKEIDQAFERLLKKVNETKLVIGDSQPNVSHDGKYIYMPNSYWTKGFWPGVLWTLFHATDQKDDSLKEIAIKCEDRLDEVLDNFYMLNHDNGFVFNLTSIAQYKYNQNPESRKRALKAASHLAGRFNIKGNFIRAWNPNAMGKDNVGWAIIDCLMNLPLLYWASEELDDPRFKHIGMAHIDTALKYTLRENGSTHHITCFNPHTGEHVGYNKGQGYTETSAWARGTSWAVYGTILSYMWTKEERYLEAAKKAANFWISKTKEQKVPRWDFDAPDTMPATDASAAACAACGLLELSKHVSKEESEKYYNWGLETLLELDKNFTNYDNDEDGIITGCTFNHNTNSGINSSLIYGDYFFTEGLYRLKFNNKNLFW